MKITKQMKQRINGLKCDLFRRIELRNIYLRNADHFRRMNDQITADKYKDAAKLLNAEIWINMHYKANLPFIVETF